MRINQNIAAFDAFRNLSVNQDSLSKSLQRLSSGYRINSAADDAAGLAKSESLRSEIGGTSQAVQNAQDGVSWLQTAEGSLNEVHSILQRMRDLAVSASNTATSDGSTEQTEFTQLVSEIGSIGTRTTFAGKSVFADYSTNKLTFHVGAGSADELQVASDLRIDTTGATGIFTGNLSTIDLTTGAKAAITAVDTAIGKVSSARSTLGATQNRLEHTVSNLNVTLENLSASESRIRDADMAQEMVSFTRNQIMVQAGTAMLAQANQVPQTVLQLLK